MFLFFLLLLSPAIFIYDILHPPFFFLVSIKVDCVPGLRYTASSLQVTYEHENVDFVVGDKKEGKEHPPHTYSTYMCMFCFIEEHYHANVYHEMKWRCVNQGTFLLLQFVSVGAVCLPAGYSLVTTFSGETVMQFSR